MTWNNTSRFLIYRKHALPVTQPTVKSNKGIIKHWRQSQKIAGCPQPFIMHHPTSSRCFMNFTGFQSIRESGTSWRWQFTSAYTDWRRRTWRTTVWQSLPLLASDTYGPLAPGYCQYQEQGPRSGWGVLQSQVHSSGTVYQPPCKPQLSPHWRSLDIWRSTCSSYGQRVWGPFMMCYTNTHHHHHHPTESCRKGQRSLYIPRISSSSFKTLEQ